VHRAALRNAVSVHSADYSRGELLTAHLRLGPGWLSEKVLARDHYGALSLGRPYQAAASMWVAHRELLCHQSGLIRVIKRVGTTNTVYRSTDARPLRRTFTWSSSRSCRVRLSGSQRSYSSSRWPDHFIKRAGTRKTVYWSTDARQLRCTFTWSCSRSCRVRLSGSQRSYSSSRWPDHFIKRAGTRKTVYWSTDARQLRCTFTWSCSRSCRVRLSGSQRNSSSSRWPDHFIKRAGTRKTVYWSTDARQLRCTFTWSCSRSCRVHLSGSQRSSSSSRWPDHFIRHVGTENNVYWSTDARQLRRTFTWSCSWAAASVSCGWLTEYFFISWRWSTHFGKAMQALAATMFTRYGVYEMQNTDQFISNGQQARWAASNTYSYWHHGPSI